MISWNLCYNLIHGRCDPIWRLQTQRIANTNGWPRSLVNVLFPNGEQRNRNEAIQLIIKILIGEWPLNPELTLILNGNWPWPQFWNALIETLFYFVISMIVYDLSRLKPFVSPDLIRLPSDVEQNQQHVCIHSYFSLSTIFFIGNPSNNQQKLG